MTWDQWLHSESCNQVLLRSAAKVVDKARGYGLPCRILFPSAPEASAGSGVSAGCFEDLAHDLWLFVNDHAVNWEKSRPFDILLAQGTDRIAEHIASSYTRTLLDRVRTQEVDPQKAFYRRLRQVIAKDPRFLYRAQKRATFYACAEGAQPDPSAPMNAPPADYAQWPDPPSIPRKSAPPDARTLGDMALFFCREYQKRMGGPVWVPVRELTRYLAPLLKIPRAVRLEPLERPSSEHDDELGKDPTQVAPTQETALTRIRLFELARSATASWSPREKKAFALRWGDEENLERIAQALGYGGPSGARYLLEGLRQRLLDFCLLWPGLSPPDLDETLFKELFEALVSVCKEEGEGRREG
ncbi:MAG: hypothetical protein WHS86_15145 [Desulfosoma sp.]